MWSHQICQAGFLDRVMSSRALMAGLLERDSGTLGVVTLQH
jgi:hypothetical protein